MALRPVLLIKTGNENTEEITRQATFLTVASLTHHFRSQMKEKIRLLSRKEISRKLYGMILSESSVM